jgi:prepilin-type N-terminal cleavage/methylation domain-containing protein
MVTIVSSNSRRGQVPVRSRKRPRRGMTLIEVMIAVVILTTAVLGMGKFMTSFVHNVSTDNLNAVASQLVASRLEEVKGATNYNTLETVFAKSESSLPPYTGFTRSTLIKHIGGGPADLYDYKTVTVIVTLPGGTQQVKKTTIISAF